MTAFDQQTMIDVRHQFPALRREQNGRPVIYFDGPAGTQVPTCVAKAMSDYLLHFNANKGGPFATSRESDEWLGRAFQAFADFVGASDPQEIVFGQNMTSLTFALSRSLANTWSAGDEVVVTRLDHDANITPWVLAARDAGATVRWVDFHREDCTLDMGQMAEVINERTRLVAVGAASNATGGIQPVREVADLAHQVGAQVFVDAVHYAPHGPIDVAAWDADFVAFSAYKFFGPHLGTIWGRRSWLESLPAYQVRPAPTAIPGKWMTGTQSHESIVGGMAAIDYLAGLGGEAHSDDSADRRARLLRAFDAIRVHESALADQFLDGVAQLPGIHVHGITQPDHRVGRFATFSITADRIPTPRLARGLAEAGIQVWAGNYYALEFSEQLGLEPEGMVRIGMVHYNTADEVDRLLEELERQVGSDHS